MKTKHKCIKSDLANKSLYILTLTFNGAKFFLIILADLFIIYNLIAFRGNLFHSDKDFLMFYGVFPVGDFVNVLIMLT